MRELELMGTVGCHLCDEAESIIVKSVDMSKVAIYQVDIADDERLMEKYAVRIPVLVDLASQRELEWPFDHKELEQFFSSLVAEV